MTDWPRPLADAHGPIREDKLDGAAEGMGAWGAQTRALATDGIVPPVKKCWAIQSRGSPASNS